MSKTNKDIGARALAAWRAAQTEKQSADAQLRLAREALAEAEDRRSPGTPLAAEHELPFLDAQIAALKAADALAAVEAEAAARTHAQELAQGDPDALAVDLPTVRAEAQARLDRAAALQAEAVAERKHAAALVHDVARSAQTRIAERRQQENEPPPPPIPLGSAGPAGGTPAVEATLRAIAERIDQGPELGRNAAQIGRLEREANELRANLERTHRRREQERADEEAYEKNLDAERRRFDEQQRETWQQQTELGQAEAAKQTELADAYRARQQGPA